jgi:hypothetical protein
LADVARVSLAFGNEHRAAEPTTQDLLKCLHMHNNLGHPGLAAQEPGAAVNTLLQLAFYQFPFQRSPAHLTGRSIALFEQTTVPEFGHIPADRPILGIVVTLEDFHVVNSPLHQPLYTRSKKLPTLAVPVEELEGIVCLGPDTARFLLDNITETVHNASLRLALSHQNVPLNPS